jgi:predicted metalloendopeptidase
MFANVLYVRSHSNEAGHKFIIKMITDLKVEFEEVLNESSWLDDKTKAAAIEKIRPMDGIAGYYKILLDNEVLNDYYRKAKVFKGEYFKSFMSMQKFKETKDFTANFVLELWGKSMLQVDFTQLNAFYFRRLSLFGHRVNR